MNKSIVGSQVSQEELEKKLSNVIMRQTDYNEAECIVKLRDHNYNVKKIILEYMNPPTDSIIDTSCNITPLLEKSSSQQRFKDIRRMLHR